jgi:NAD(P)-dependent dehydrogenase (short-subunit alcohol dehydrogenase family)
MTPLPSQAPRCMTPTTAAIITGSTRGIGKETAILLFSKTRANVVVCSRTQSEIDLVIKEIKKTSTSDGNIDDRLFDDRLLGIKCDVSKSLEVDHLIRSTIDKFNPLTF